MSYTNGIGGLQQAISSIAPAETTQPVQTNTSGSAVQQGSTSAANPADHADLSSAGSLVGRALEGSDARLTKVASLQQAIANGSYNVSSHDIADKIIQSLLD